MENDYQVASISEDCVSEINELQNRLNKETDKDIVLIAYPVSYTHLTLPTTSRV